MNHPTIPLNNGIQMPMLGLGVWRTPDGDATETAVACALEAGYRSIDTAKAYDNETGVGQGLRASGVPRDEVFVTTKLWNEDARQGNVREAFEASMDRLGLEVLDLFLLHWPVPGKYLAAWEVLEELYGEGRIRAIGVSNFLVHHLDDLLAHAKVVPAVNQIEFHPKLQSPELVGYCEERDIAVEAWSPIMRGQVVDVPEIVQLADALGKTPVQVTLRWQIQRGIVTIPKSANPERIRANADIFDFELDDAQMETMDSLDDGLRLGPDPDNFSF
jgi:diketogulonate reductase-like aldo/keto reductase